MRAVRVRKHDGRSYVMHWLADDGWTECGKRMSFLVGAEQVDLDSLGPEACDVCEELGHRKNWKQPAVIHRLPGRGVLRKQGPLYHGLKDKGGQYLQDDD